MSRVGKATVIDSLKGEGFLSDDISMLFADTTGTTDFGVEHEG